ncbi:MAG: hypothetical protein KUG77_24605 [Nannocystaceae bacterium]|nr:hypothetical protein [Nannocystaceae bacterium]
MRTLLGLGLFVGLVGCGGDSAASEAMTATDTDTDTVSSGLGMSSSMGSGTSMGGTTGAPTTTGATAASSSGAGSSGEGESSSAGETTGGVADAPQVDVSDPQLYEFELDPAELDATVVDNLEVQFAHLDTRAEPIGKLVIFLSGYTNTPSSWRDHGRQIAGHGFHVIEPDYANDWTCDGGSPTCSTDSRWEALVGEAISDAIDISRADSAEGRVVTMLRHLEQAHPGGDWAWYLNDDDSLRYEHIVIAGISHGASSTGLYATRRPFSRAVMHSGGWWDVDASTMTPVSEFYGLTHVDDAQHPGHLDAWDSAGLSGDPAVIEELEPPYGDSHRLVATTPNGYPHCSVCVSGNSPLEGDAYLFDPAWRYMYGAPQL